MRFLKEFRIFFCGVPFPAICPLPSVPNPATEDDNSAFPHRKEAGKSAPFPDAYDREPARHVPNEAT